MAKAVAKEPCQPENSQLVRGATLWESLGGALLSDRGSFFSFGLTPLPLVAARHRNVASTASDNFVTPKPRRATRQHPNTQQQASRKKLRIVFSSDESSDEGAVLPYRPSPGGVGVGQGPVGVPGWGWGSG